jgi:hypothetical protein
VRSLRRQLQATVTLPSSCAMTGWLGLGFIFTLTHCMCDTWCSGMAHQRHTVGTIVLLAGSLIEVSSLHSLRLCTVSEPPQLSVAAFLITRYQKGERTPHPSFPTVCWYIIAVSVLTIFVCAVAPFFRTLRKSRWIHWAVIFLLWIVAGALGFRGLGRKEDDEGRYCER